MAISTITTAALADDAVTAAKIDDDGTGFTVGDLTVSGATTQTGALTGASTVQGTTITATTAFVPDASGGADIGTTALEFGDVYIADDKQIKFGSDQDATIEYDEDGNDRLLVSGAVTEFGKAVIGETLTDTSNTGSVTLDFDAYQNFILTFTGNVTLAAPSTEKVGQSGVIVIIQDGTGSRTLSLHGDYETAGGDALSISTAGSAVDVLPYFVKAANSIQLGAPQTAFS